MRIPSKIKSPAFLFIGWIVLFTLLPFAIILGMSFLKKNDLGTVIASPTLQNYVRCFHWIYLRVFLKTIWLAGAATLSCLLVGFPVAYYLARSPGRMKQFGLILLFVPFWTNFILRIHGIMSLIGNNGLINQLLENWGFTQHPIQMLYTRGAVYVGLLYNYLPFLVVPIFSALEKLDPSLREAAQDLGASRWQTFTRVIIPNVREGITVGSLFVFIPMMGEYVIPDLLGGAKEVFLGNIMVGQFYVMGDWPFGSAIAGFLSLMMLAALYLQSRGGHSLTPTEAV